MSATTVPKASDATERPSVLENYRDDGPLATALGRALGRGVKLPAIALLLVAGLPLLVAIVLKGEGASTGLVAGVLAWAVLAGGSASARPLTDRLRWAAPPALRALEYAGLLWIAAVAGGDSLPAAFALLCAITYHHYESVYGLRHRGVTPPAWARAAGLGWDGRLLLGVVLLLAGGLPAGFYVAAALLAVLFMGETVVEWRRFRLGQQPAYDDEEDDPD
jgi:hypothetical protein